MPASVIIIEDSAFAFNRISQLTLGEGVQTIGVGAFLANNLTSVTVPDSLTLLTASHPRVLPSGENTSVTTMSIFGPQGSAIREFISNIPFRKVPTGSFAICERS